jgi:hypothetical protein
MRDPYLERESARKEAERERRLEEKYWRDSKDLIRSVDELVGETFSSIKQITQSSKRASVFFGLLGGTLIAILLWSSIIQVWFFLGGILSGFLPFGIGYIAAAALVPYLLFRIGRFAIGLTIFGSGCFLCAAIFVIIIWCVQWVAIKVFIPQNTQVEPRTVIRPAPMLRK